MRNYAIIFLVLSFYCVYSQEQNLPGNIPSPNAASFAVFGNVPVNLFTGTPDISIPLYQVKEAQISMPITLNYHPASVQPNAHPGWTGLGWSLLSGGVISRIQHGFPDEQKMQNGNAMGFYYNYDQISGSDYYWFIPANLKVYAVNQVFPLLSRPYPIDAMADEFTFNFLGYSGKFMMGHDGQWKVFGNDKIKVVVDPLDGIIDGSKLKTSVNGSVSGSIKRPSSTTWYNSYYYFNKFKLITPDGTTYEFGGFDATEYSIPYRDQAEGRFSADSWFLTKIRTQNGKEINLTYERGDMICTLAHSYGYIKYNTVWYPKGTTFTGHSTNLTRRPADGSLVFPTYLKTIETSFERIEFNRSESTELRYSTFDFGSPWDDVYANVFWYFKGPYADPATDPALELKWPKLDEIRVSDLNGAFVKSFKFQYTNSADTRLKLNSVFTVSPYPTTENGRPIVDIYGGVVSDSYSFIYNSQPLPAYCSNAIDHWGYHNGYIDGTLSATTLDEWTSAYFTAREPDKTGRFINSELLNTVYYPTGGYTTYEFEPHRYSKVVDTNRSTLNSFSTDQYAGGARIKRIASYGEDGTLLLAKDYLYVKEFAGQADVSSLRSSGILGGQIQYYWPDYHGLDYSNREFIYSVFSSNSLLPSYTNGQGSHIGYSEAIERISGNGYTKYNFSNFDSDVFGVMHGDDLALAQIDSKTSIYFPYSSRSVERGAPQLIQVFDQNNFLVKSTKIKYERSDTEVVRCVDLRHLVIPADPAATSQTDFGTAYFSYIYNFNKVREETSVYDSDKDGFSTSVVKYHYNANNLVDEIATINSDGNESKSEIIFPSDLANGSTPDDAEAKAIQIMSDPNGANMINVPIEITEYYNGKVIKSEITKYTYLPTGIVPSSKYSARFMSPVTDYNKISTSGSGASTILALDARCKRTETYSYDNLGSVKEITREDGVTTVYLWGHNHQYVIAKIVNASYQRIEDELGRDFLRHVEIYSDYSSRLRNAVSLRNAFIWTYSYNPPFCGLTSMTDQNNFTTYYTYDNLYRLHFVLDSDGNVLKAYDYNTYQKK